MEQIRNDALQTLMQEAGSMDSGSKALVQRAGPVQRCDVMSTDHCTVVLLDNRRVILFLRHAVQPNLLHFRGVIADFAMKFAHLKLPAAGVMPLWTFALVLPHSAKGGSTLTVLEGISMKANSAETADLLMPLVHALSTACKLQKFWLPVICTDVSAVLSLGVSKAFNGVPYSESCACLKERMRVFSNSCAGIRAEYIDVMTALTALAPPAAMPAALPAAPGAPAPAAARLPLAVQSAAVSAVASPPPAVQSAAVAAAVAAARDGASASAVLDAPDVLQYKAAEAEGQMVLTLSDCASGDLRVAVAVVEEATAGHTDSATRAFLLRAAELLCYMAPTMPCIQGITVITHCRPHKYRAIARTCKYGSSFKALGPDQAWAGACACNLIMAPFGAASMALPDSSPFEVGRCRLTASKPGIDFALGFSA